MKTCIAVLALLLVAFAPSEAQVACGGQVTLTSVAVSSTTTAGATVSATITFSTVGNLANTDKVTLNFPSGYFANGQNPTGVTGLTSTAATGVTGASTVIITAGAAAVAGNYIVTLAGLILGAPMQPTSLCNGFTVSTATNAGAVIDTASSSVAANAIGGLITAFSAFTLGSVVVGATTSTILVTYNAGTALANNDVITIKMPLGYVTAITAGTVTGISASVAVITAGTATDTITVTATGAVAAGAVSFTIAAVTIGAVRAAVTNGICVSTNKDSGVCRDAVQIGGSITAFSAFTLGSVVAGATGSTIVVTYNAGTALANNDVITIKMPMGYVSAITAGTVTGITASVAVITAGTPTDTITVTATNTVAAGAVSFTINAVTIGPKFIPATSCTTVSVATNRDVGMAFAAGASAIGGLITAFSAFTPSTLIPGDAGTLVVTYNAGTALANNDVITIKMPMGYVSAITAGTVTGITASVAVITAGTPTDTITVTATNTVAAGAVSFTINAVTMSTVPMLAVANGISLSTNKDNAATANAPALGGQVTLTSVTPSSSTPMLGSSTLTLVFVLATKVLNGGTVTLTYPTGYITSGVTPSISGLAATVGATGASSLPQVIMTANTAAGLPAATYTVILSGLTLGAIMAAPCQYFSVATSSDLRSVGAVTGAALGKTTTVTAFTTSTAVPLATASLVTVTFTTATNIASGGTVVLSYPSSYITGTPTTPVVASAGFAASIGVLGGNSVTMTTTAAVTAGSFTVTIAGVTMGGPTPAVPAGIAISTATDSIGTRFTAPKLGGVATVTGFVPSSRVPLTTASSVVVTFTTATNIASGGTVVLSYPSSYITGTPTTPVVASAGFAASIGVLSGNSVTMTTTAAVTAGSFTVTIAGVTMGGPMQISSSGSCGSAAGVSISTSTDSAGTMFTPPNLGGMVSVTSFTPSTRVPTTASSILTVAFTTQTNIASGGFVTLFVPSGFVSGSPTLTASTGFAASIAAFGAIGSSGNYGSVMTTTAAVTAGSFTITVSGVTMGAPVQYGTTVNVGMMTSTDGNGGNVASGSLGGVVSSPMVTIAAADRVASTANRKVIVSFGIATPLTTSDTIVVGYPNGFLTSGVTGTLSGSTSGLAVTLSATSVGNTITLTPTAAVTAGTYSATICGLTIGSGVAVLTSVSGIRVSTSKDTVSCAVNTAVSTVKGQVSLVGLSIPWASRVSGTSGTSPVLTFTTATSIPANSCTGNAVTVSITSTGTQFFTQTSSVCSVLTALTASGFTTVGIAQDGTNKITTLTLSTNAALAAGAYTVTLGGLTFGSSAGLDTGLGVVTAMDTVGQGPTGPLSGYRVDKVTVSSGCTSGSCGSVAVQFTSLVAISSTLAITFSSGALIDSDTPAFMLGAALATPAVSGTTVTLTLTGTTTVPAGQYTVTLVGRIQAKAAGSVSVGTSTPLYSQSYAGTSTAVTTSSLAITGALPNNQAASGSITFTTNAAVGTNGNIFITYKTGFFVVPPAVFSSTGCSVTQGNIATSFTSPVACVSFTAAAPVADSPSVGLTTITLTNSGTAALPAGVNTISFAGGKLGAAQSSSTTFAVTTSAEICSAGSIASGSISNSNPGGSAAAGTSLLLSAAAALACALLLLL